MQISKSEWLLQVNQKLHFGSLDIWYKKGQSNITVYYVNTYILLNILHENSSMCIFWSLQININDKGENWLSANYLHFPDFKDGTLTLQAIFVLDQFSNILLFDFFQSSVRTT